MADKHEATAHERAQFQDLFDRRDERLISFYVECLERWGETALL